MEFKQVILVRHDLQLPKGKLAAQAAHAAVEATLRSDKDAVKHWRMNGMAKVVLKVAGEKELYGMLQRAKDAGLVSCSITDAGRTVVAPGTVTCGAVGPAPESELDALFGNLKLL